MAMAFVYFEKLALRGKLNKQNRKLCAGACVLLAAKIGSDLKKHEVKHLIDVSGLHSDGHRSWSTPHPTPLSGSCSLQDLVGQPTQEVSGIMHPATGVSGCP